MMIYMLMMMSIKFMKNSIMSNTIIMAIMMFWLSNQMQLSMQYTMFAANMAWDMLSILLIVLTSWIVLMMFLLEKPQYNSYIHMSTMKTLFIILTMTFSVTEYMSFYIFFEISLVPTLLLIMGWGYQPERIQAGTYFIMYTMSASLPLFSMIIYSYMKLNTLSFMVKWNIEFNNIQYIAYMLAFFVKTPVFFFHLWLPKAHVEAPAVGSMILAGVLLKLGGYGMIRLMLKMNIQPQMNEFLASIFLMGGLFAGMLCLAQTDIKHTIALSSVNHMAVMILGLLMMTKSSCTGAIITMISHGMTSSGLFFVTSMTYKRFKTRSLTLLTGIHLISPMFMLWWFIMLATNMSAPPSLNLLGEIIIYLTAVNWSFMLMLILALITFFSAAYSLMLYLYLCHTNYSMLKSKMSSLTPKENLISLAHMYPLILMFGLNWFA